MDIGAMEDSQLPMAKDFGGLSSQSNLFNHLCDGILQTEDGQCIPVHRVLLSIISPLFQKVFVDESYKNGSNVCKIKDIKADTLQQIIDYSINEKISLNDENIQDLTLASAYWEIKDLLKVCRDYILSHLSRRNCAKLYAASHKIQHSELSQHCQRFLEVHFGKLEAESLVNLTSEPLATLLQSDDLNVSGEKTIFDLLHLWLRNNPECEGEIASQLLECLRLDPPEIASVAKGVEDGVFKNMLIAKTTSIPPTTLKQKKRPVPPSKTYTVFQLYSNKCSCRITYDDKMDFWREWFTVPFVPTAVISYSGGDTTYILHIASCWSTRPNQDYPQRLPDLGISRRGYSLAIVGGLLYVIGGYLPGPSKTKLTTVERYNPTTGHWSWVQPMLKPSAGPATILDGKIYVLDSSDYGDRPCVQSYNPSFNVWRRLPLVNDVYKTFSILAFHERVCVLVERSEYLVLMQYDPGNAAWRSTYRIPASTFVSPMVAVVGDNIVLYEDSELVEDPVAFVQDTRHKWKETQDPLLRNLRRFKIFSVEDQKALEKLRHRNLYDWTSVKSAFE